MRYFTATVALALLGLGLLGDRSTGADDDKDWVTIKGQIVFAGKTIIKPEKVKIDTDEKHCSEKGEILEEKWVIDQQTKGVRWVYVWLAPDKADLLQKKRLPVHPSLREIEMGKAAVYVDQPFCRFEPHAVAVREGQNLVLKNSSPVAHNVGWVGLQGFNPSGTTRIDPGKTHTIEGLKQQGGPIPLNSTSHTWMKGWVRVFDHPYFAVTDEKGNFEIKKAPAGKCRLIVWHEEASYHNYEDFEINGMKAKLPGQSITLKGSMVNDLGKVELKPAEK
jgi:hypothetical protein